MLGAALPTSPAFTVTVEFQSRVRLTSTLHSSRTGLEFRSNTFIRHLQLSTLLYLDCLRRFVSGTLGAVSRSSQRHRRPSSTSPKTTCLPSSQVVMAVVMKNCEPLVSWPAFAMPALFHQSVIPNNVMIYALSSPFLLCLSLKFSSANFCP